MQIDVDWLLKKIAAMQIQIWKLEEELSYHRSGNGSAATSEPKEQYRSVAEAYGDKS